MTWPFLLALCAGAYAQKAVGPLVLGAWEPPARVRAALHLLAVPVLAGLIVVQALGDGRALVIDARAPALLVAVVAVALRAPFLVVVLLAALVAAGLRALGMD